MSASADDKSLPIASYTENVRGIQRRFEIFAGRLTVRGNWVTQPVGVLNIPLQRMRPRYRLQRGPSNEFYACLSLSAIGFVCLLVIILRSSDWVDACSGMAAGVSFALCVSTFIGALLTARRIEFAVFQGDGVKLFIARDGPDSANFSSFIERLAAQITFCSGIDGSGMAPTRGQHE